ncbi:interleukin-13 receptor subunit alpha-1-like [Carcharodon carcharias]|uniref:interleukin-13 receptor subunit alpha-1-like n=1 Tax=Carcharodon carcharias TaxID=13397 RepID=UPI001B7EA343|nr:interleukin-13 receptor subunit alpha-1-like [Carcharodon carcharias]
MREVTKCEMPGVLPPLFLLSLSCLLISRTEGFNCCALSVTLPPPNHLTVTLKGIGFINSTWAWKPPSDLENFTNLSVRFDSSFKYDDAEWKERKINPCLTREDKVVLNQGITFKVKALVTTGSCACGESNWTEMYIPPAEGDVGTAVRNIKCIYYNFEHINCTWDIGSKAPSDTVYNFNYWQDGKDIIQNCTSYISKDGRLDAGCHLERDQFDDQTDLNICVTGVSASAKIKPFFYNLETANFVKLSPPWGINISKTGKAFDINWGLPAHWNLKCVNYQIRRRSSISSNWLVQNCENPNAKITDANPNVKNIIQVRAKYTICGDNAIWSEWSEGTYFGEDIGRGWNWKIALLIIIPILVAAAAITLLTYLKQLQILILPPIPDPGKLFKGMFGDSNGDYSMWNKQPKGSLIYKAEEEITCQVTTVEQLKHPAEGEEKLDENERLEETLITFVDQIHVKDDNLHYDLVRS